MNGKHSLLSTAMDGQIKGKIKDEIEGKNGNICKAGRKYSLDRK